MTQQPAGHPDEVALLAERARTALKLYRVAMYPQTRRKARSEFRALVAALDVRADQVDGAERDRIRDLVVVLEAEARS